MTATEAPARITAAQPLVTLNRPPARTTGTVTFEHTLSLKTLLTTEAAPPIGLSLLEAVAERLAGQHYAAAAKRLGLASADEAWLEGAEAVTDGRKLHITLYFAPYRDGCPTTVIR